MSITDERQHHRQMIERECRSQGLSHSGWRFDEDDHRECALLGRWQVSEDDEDKGLYLGDEGELYATVVGAPEYHNERVAFYFTPDEYDSPTEVTPFEDLEPE